MDNVLHITYSAENKSVKSNQGFCKTDRGGECGHS